MEDTLETLQDRARKLGCWIDQLDLETEWDPEINKGHYLLLGIASNKPIWAWGLPIAGIADALDCYGRELEGDGEAWANFGEGWLPAVEVAS
jgi:hypothetical protein